MEVHEWARTLGEIGTMIAAIVAVATYISTTRKNLRIGEAERAVRIRERLQRVVAETQKLQTEAHRGTALIAASAAVAHEIETRLSPVTTREEIEEVLSNNKLILSATITGWHKSRAGVEVSDRIAQLELEASQLSGKMKIITVVIELLAATINDGCSPTILYNILSEARQLEEFRFDLSSAQRTKRLIDQVTVTLQSNSASYYLARYDKAILSMRQFIEIAVSAFSALPDKKLILLEEGPVSRRVEGATMTASIRQQLREIETVLNIDDRNTLNTVIDNLEVYVTKDHALLEVKRFSRREG